MESGLVHCQDQSIEKSKNYVGRGRVLTEFSEAEEKRLVTHIFKLLKLGFGLTTDELNEHNALVNDNGNQKHQ